LRQSSELIRSITESQKADLRLAASKLRGWERRSFQAEMALKYCEGNARIAERVFGWGRVNIEVGLAEKRTGIICIGAQARFTGIQRWEEKYPEAAAALLNLAERHSQQDPTFQSTIAYTRLTAKEALKQLQSQGFSPLPSPSTMAEILNRLGYRLRPVLKAKPPKNFPKQTPSLPISPSKMTPPPKSVSNA
jgi:Rhodopirellula transposase DDE domain